MNIESIENNLKFYDDEIKYVSVKISNLKNNKKLLSLIRETNALYKTVKISTENNGENHETTNEAKCLYELSKKQVVAIKKNLGISNYTRLRENLQDMKKDYLTEIKNNIGAIRFYLSDITNERYDFFNSCSVYISISRHKVLMNNYCLYDSFDYSTKHEFFEELISVLEPNYNGTVRFELYSNYSPSLYIIKSDNYKLTDDNGNELLSTESVHELFDKILQWKK